MRMAATDAHGFVSAGCCSAGQALRGSRLKLYQLPAKATPTRASLSPRPTSHLDQVLGEGAAVDDGGLGTAHLGGRHQLHGIRDLLRVLH